MDAIRLRDEWLNHRLGRLNKEMNREWVTEFEFGC